MAVVTVEEVSGRAAFRRFFEFAHMQFRDEPRWSPPVVAVERARLDPHRNRFFDTGDGEYFIARRQGTVAGRITAHVADRAGDGRPGWFGFFDAVDDADVVRALVDRAAAWLVDHGCTAMTGPASFTPDDDRSVLVAGFDAPGTTGRPWHPPWYAAHLEAAGLTRTDVTRTWRLTPSSECWVDRAAIATRSTQHSQGAAGRFGDPRLVLDGIEAVPDLSPARGSSITLARRAKRRDWAGCTIVRVDGDPAVLVPQLVAAARDAGYAWVVSPWSPDEGAPPETEHARYTRPL